MNRESGRMGVSTSRRTMPFLLSLIGLLCSATAQDLMERDALCDADGCYAVYFQRKTFLEAWRSCKERGGNLATAKRQEEANAITSLFADVDLRQRAKVQVWMGLQRQPRQCAPNRPLRGYAWTTGDKDTQYTNWLRDDTPDTCQGSRCVVIGYSTAPHERHDNLKWQEGSCTVRTDGYLCRFTYKGMCPAVRGEGGGNALYTTPFNLLSSLLTHLPFGSVATVPCPPGAREDEQSVLCMLREDGTVGWSRDAPLCGSDGEHGGAGDEDEEDWCGQDNGGCEHYCRPAGAHYFCECSDGFRLADDGQSCQPADPCAEAPCEFECLPLSDSYRCACPDGYMLAPDEQGCLDVDECLQSPCEQLCVNAPGTFECRCREGYRTDDEGECEDVDECMEDDPCEHACENTPGSHVCHCNLGFVPLAEDPTRCQDMDECQIPETCQQMCVNYEGSFDCYCNVGYELMSDHFSCRRIEEGEGPPTATAAWGVTRHPDPPVWPHPMDPVYDHWNPDQSQTAWMPEEGEEGEALDWLTDPPRVESDVIWVTHAPQERPVGEMIDPTHPDSLTEEREGVPDWLDQREAWAHPEWETTLGSTTDRPLTPYTVTEDYYDDHEEEETTTSPTLHPTTTISGGAWNWLPANQEPAARPVDEVNTPGTEFSDETDLDETDTADDITGFPTVRVVEDVAWHHEAEEKEEGATPSSTPDAPLSQPPPPPPSSPSHGAGEGVGEGSKGSGQSQEGSSWLLVGLLVPLCIFVVVMVALGIVYCTRCVTAQPRNKTATDCYHWISGAHDKQGAVTGTPGATGAGAASGVKGQSHV